MAGNIELRRAIMYLTCLDVYGQEQWFLDAEEMAARVGRGDTDAFLNSFCVEVMGSQFLIFSTIWDMIYDFLIKN